MVAGEPFTPRDGLRLMADLALKPIVHKIQTGYQVVLFVPNRSSFRYMCGEHALKYGPASWRMNSRCDLADAVGEVGSS